MQQTLRAFEQLEELRIIVARHAQNLTLNRIFGRALSHGLIVRSSFSIKAARSVSLGFASRLNASHSSSSATYCAGMLSPYSSRISARTAAGVMMTVSSIDVTLPLVMILDDTSGRDEDGPPERALRGIVSRSPRRQSEGKSRKGGGTSMTFQGALITEQGITFGIVIVQSHVLNNQMEANRLISAFSGE